MERLISFNDLLLEPIHNNFLRYLYSEIDWGEKMIAIKGSRGVGKTTLMLQRQKYGLKAEDGESLYISMDHPYFYTETLFDLADEFYKKGGRILFIDEVHKYPKWSRELKVIYDGFPNMKIIFSSSSALDIYKGESDLSRRVITYNLPGLSLREFLNYKYNLDLQPYSLDHIIENHRTIAQNLNQLPTFHLLPEFSIYLQYGYLPIGVNENIQTYGVKLNQIINTVLDTDLAYTDNYTPATSYKLKKLLGLLAESVPYQPNISDLSRKLEISREYIYTFIKLLNKSVLINLLFADGKGGYILQKPEKIFLENTNLAYALQEFPNKGAVRETFMLNQLLNKGHKIFYPKKGDFFVNGFTIEVGGKNKSEMQIQDSEKGIIASDDILSGFGKKIPLWLFGFLY